MCSTYIAHTPICMCYLPAYLSTRSIFVKVSVSWARMDIDDNPSINCLIFLFFLSSICCPPSHSLPSIVISFCPQHGTNSKFLYRSVFILYIINSALRGTSFTYIWYVYLQRKKGMFFFLSHFELECVFFLFELLVWKWWPNGHNDINIKYTLYKIQVVFICITLYSSIYIV